MFIVALLIVGGLALLAAGAESLVRGSAGLALRLGVTPLVIGLTVVAFGTGSPELVVSIEASSGGNGAIALGNVVGSNISNVALILGLAALARPLRVRSELIRREVPLMIFVTLLLCLLLLDGTLSRTEGAFLAAGSVGFTIFAYVAARRSREPATGAEFEDVFLKPKRPVWLDVVFVAAGLAALLAGAKLLLVGAVAVAENFGISQVVIGLTIIAVGTSLPELATSLVAAVRKESDVALGNVVGSNVLNILCILGVAAIISPIRTEGLRPLDLGVMMGSAMLLLPLLWRGFVLNRWEGALLLAGYVVYVYTLLP